MAEYIERAEETEFINKCLDHEEKLQSVERETLIAVKKYLESIPVAGVRPVVHGKWVEQHTNIGIPNVCYFSSCCGFPTWYGKSNFCPNCGADMREEKE